ncbi:MAG: hypothetical protein AB7S26_10010 [Sandaracinaceae bacterium]
MRVSVLAVSLVLCLMVGCVGGQTGEITMLGACHEDVGPGELSEVSAALDAMGRAHAPSITWLDARLGSGDTELAIAIAERGPARSIGGEGCEHPFSSAPATVRATSGDGAIDVTLEGAAANTTTGGYVVDASSDYDGVLGQGRIRLEVSADTELVTGMLLFEPLDPNVDSTSLALF